MTNAPGLTDGPPPDSPPTGTPPATGRTWRTRASSLEEALSALDDLAELTDQLRSRRSQR